MTRYILTTLENNQLRKINFISYIGILWKDRNFSKKDPIFEIFSFISKYRFFRNEDDLNLQDEYDFQTE